MSGGNLYLSQPPFGPAIIGRGMLVRGQIREKTNATGYGDKDISSRWTYQIRAWDAGAETPTFIINEDVAVSSTDSATGWIDDYVSMGTSEYESALEFELNELDGDTADSNTPSGQRETTLIRWRQSIDKAATA